MPQTKSLNCQLKCEHKNTTFLPIKELQRPTKISYLTTERTKEDYDWIGLHDSINRADLLQISSNNGSVLLINNGIKLLCVSYGMFRSGRLTAFLHATSKSLLLLSYNDHNSHPYLLLQYVWNNLVLAEQFNLLKKHITLLTWPMMQLRLKRTSINQSINQKRIRVIKVTNVTARPLLQC